MKKLEDFLKPTQEELFKMLCKLFDSKAYKCDKNFILVEGEVPIMLVAHLDTVHQEPVREICKSPDKNILMSPQGIGGDDRCGVYTLVNAYYSLLQKPWLLFTCDEEIGGIGADIFCHMHRANKLPLGIDNLKCLIEIDRKGSNDAVYYECDNPDFEKYITSKGFKTAIGSFSDISVIAPELGIAAVNLSSGYYNAHTLHEYINKSELDTILIKVIDIVIDATKDDFPKYKYREKVYKFYDYEPGTYVRYYESGKWQKWSNHKNDTKKSKAKHNNFDSYDIIEEDLFMKELPSEYEELYEELLTVYTKDELEKERAHYGDRIIYELYVETFGPFYSYDQK